MLCTNQPPLRIVWLQELFLVRFPSGYDLFCDDLNKDPDHLYSEDELERIAAHVLDSRRQACPAL
jgi:hypothetical protein